MDATTTRILAASIALAAGCMLFRMPTGGRSEAPVGAALAVTDPDNAALPPAAADDRLRDLFQRAAPTATPMLPLRQPTRLARTGATHMKAAAPGGSEAAPLPSPAPVGPASEPPAASDTPPAVPLSSAEAREALRLVGVDTEAEAAWVQAINDPNRSDQERQDLIEDLNEEGFPDPKHPTPDDLPLIQNRLALIEELAPDALDQVNADAFAEAYKDLLYLYARLRRP